jgi:hypothetical protein
MFANEPSSRVRFFYEVFRFGDETLYAAHRRIVGLREPEGSRDIVQMSFDTGRLK